MNKGYLFQIYLSLSSVPLLFSSHFSSCRILIQVDPTFCIKKVVILSQNIFFDMNKMAIWFPFLFLSFIRPSFLAILLVVSSCDLMFIIIYLSLIHYIFIYIYISSAVLLIVCPRLIRTSTQRTRISRWRRWTRTSSRYSSTISISS